MTSETPKSFHLTPHVTPTLTRLPREIRFQIINWAIFGTTLDDLSSLNVIFIDNGSSFRYHDARSIYETPGPNLSILLVNRQIYYESLYILFHCTQFEITPTFGRTAKTFERLPEAGLKMIRSIRKSARAKNWRTTIHLISRHCDLEKMDLEVDLKIAAKWCQGTGEVGDKRRRAVYEYYMFITGVLCGLKGLKDVKFVLGWAGELRGWMRREILGDSYQGDIGTASLLDLPKTVAKEWYDGWTNVPDWHEDDRAVPGSNFSRD